MEPQSPRLPFFDTLRGFALVIMTIYHFCFDLNHFGLLQQNMNGNIFWLSYRALIMTLFTGLVGVGFSLGTIKPETYQRRLGKLFASAALISLSTYILFPDSWVYFGILHFIFLASLLAPLLVRFPSSMLPLGLFFVLLPLFFRDPWFSKPILILTGLAPSKPQTIDFSPLLPWLGVTMLGIFLGMWIKQTKEPFFRREISWLSLLGRHSLLYYLGHQAVLLPLAWLLNFIFVRPGS